MSRWLLAVLLGDLVATDSRLVWIRSAHSGDEMHVQPFGQHGVPRLLDWLSLNHLLRSYAKGLIMRNSE